MGLKPISVTKTESILDIQIDLFEKVPPEDIYNFTRQLFNTAVSHLLMSKHPKIFNLCLLIL